MRLKEYLFIRAFKVRALILDSLVFMFKHAGASLRLLIEKIRLVHLQHFLLNRLYSSALPGLR